MKNREQQSACHDAIVLLGWPLPQIKPEGVPRFQTGHRCVAFFRATCMSGLCPSHGCACGCATGSARVSPQPASPTDNSGVFVDRLPVGCACRCCHKHRRHWVSHPLLLYALFHPFLCQPSLCELNQSQRNPGVSSSENIFNKSATSCQE